MSPLPPPTTIVQLPNARATQKLGLQLGQTLPAGSVLLLAGDLGSGKTTLVQGIGQGMGISEAIDSPTFTLINEYRSGRLPLYHFDLYRLDPAEAAALCPETYWEGLETDLGIVAIEWADRLLYRPQSFLHIHLTDAAAAGRQAILTAHGDFALDPSLPALTSL